LAQVLMLHLAVFAATTKDVFNVKHNQLISHTLF